MYFSDSQPDHFTDLASRLRDLVRLLLADCPQQTPVKVLGTDWLEQAPARQLYLLEQGRVRLQHQGKTVLVYEPGDLLGLSRSLKLPEGKLVADDQASLIPVNRDDLMAQANRSEDMQRHWALYLIAQTTLYREALSLEKRSQIQPSTGFLSFGPGETIIAQGDKADCVYTLLEGSAHATRDGVRVGEIHTDEMFGALAVFTRQPRNASVIADSHCSVMAVRKEDFIDLVEQQPQIGITLIEEMAAIINQLNRQIASTD